MCSTPLVEASLSRSLMTVLVSSKRLLSRSFSSREQVSTTLTSPAWAMSSPSTCLALGAKLSKPYTHTVFPLIRRDWDILLRKRST